MNTYIKTEGYHLREIYKLSDFLKALRISLKDNTFFTILSKNLIQVKLDRLILEHKEEMKLYNEEYEPLILKNTGKDPKDYTISSLMVKKINKSTKKILSLVKSVQFYSERMECIHDWNFEEKRKKIIYSLIEKID